MLSQGRYIAAKEMITEMTPMMTKIALIQPSMPVPAVIFSDLVSSTTFISVFVIDLTLRLREVRQLHDYPISLGIV